MSRTIPSFAEEGLKRFLHGMDRRIKDLERGGDWRFDTETDPESASVLLRNNAQLLVMSATGDSIAAGGDYVTFDSVISQHAFSSVSGAGDSFTHPTTGVYVLTYEHVWDNYDGGGTIILEIDGVSMLANTIADEVAGTKGRGTVHYVATAGAVGKIKVTHSSGSAETCDATVWVSISDPVASTVDNTIELSIGGVLVASTTDPLSASYSTATVLLGEPNGTVSAVSEFHFDEVSLVAGSEMLGNGGFESAVAGSGSFATTSGNWQSITFGSAVVAVSAAQASAGAQSGRVDINASGDGQSGYFFQDVALAAGDAFEFSFAVYPIDGTQYASVVFDWPRPGFAPEVCAVVMSASSTTVTAFGVSVSGAALPTGEWSTVLVRVAAQEVV